MPAGVSRREGCETRLWVISPQALGPTAGVQARKQHAHSDVLAGDPVLIAAQRLARRARDRRRELASTPFRVGMAVLLSVTLFWRAWTTSSWSWFQDDWVYLEKTQSMGFWDYLFQSYNQHLMPGQFAYVWLIAHVAPLDYTWAAGFVTLCALLSVLVWALALVEIFGERLRLMIPLVLLALSPLFLPTSLWWAAGIQIFPLQLFMGLSVLFMGRWLRLGGHKNLILLGISYACGLLLWEKALLIVVPTLYVGILIADGRLAHRVRRIVVPTALLGVVSSAYLVVYLLATRHSGPSKGVEATLLLGRSVGESLRFYLAGLLDVGLPALAGGPWGGLPSVQSTYAELVPSQWLLMLAVGLALGALALVFRKDALLAIAMTVLYAILTWGLLLASFRYDLLGTYAVHDARYAADIVPVAILTLAYMLTPTRGQKVARNAWKRPLPPRLTAHSRLIGSGVLLSLAFSTLYGNGLAWETVRPQSPKPWVTNLLSDAQAAGDGSTLDVYAPNNVSAANFFGQYSRISEMLKPAGLPLRFDEPSSRLLNVAPDGHLVESHIANSANIPPGPIKGCGYLVTSSERTLIPIQDRLYSWVWGLRMEYYSQQGGVMNVETDTSELNVPFPAGLSQIELPIRDSVSAIGLTMVAESGNVCVTKIAAGSISASDRRAVQPAASRG